MHLPVIFTLLLFLSSVVLAQDATPEPDVATTPAPSPTATPESSPSPTPEATAAGEDVIPLPPEAGAADQPMVSESDVQPIEKTNAGDLNSDAAFADPNAVIPEDNGVISDLPSAPAAGPSAGEIERKLKIRFKEVRVQVDKDPAVRELLETAQAAKSFEDERAAYREYYRLLFKKMKKIDKDLTARCEAMERAYIARLAQTRIEPTIPLNLPPQPEPMAN
jgi:hypothetical protein